MFSVKRYVVLTHLICHNCHLAVRSCNPSEPFWDQQRPRGTVWGYGHNSQLARMRNLAYAALYTCTCIDVPGLFLHQPHDDGTPPGKAGRAVACARSSASNSSALIRCNPGTRQAKQRVGMQKRAERYLNVSHYGIYPRRLQKMSHHFADAFLVNMHVHCKKISVSQLDLRRISVDWILSIVSICSVFHFFETNKVVY